MSMIVPNSDIKLLANVPLDNTYEHTIYFSTSTEQYNYFVSKAVLSLTAQSYQRVNKGTLRVSGAAESFYNCNYLMFRNSGFNNSRWFYAFITKIEYINNNVMEVTYELDVMQTWHFNYTLDDCFVDREHTATDGFFEHTITEPVNLGNEYISNLSEYFSMDDMCVCILYTDPDGGTSSVGIFNNVFTPINFSSNYPLDTSILGPVIQAIEPKNILAIYQYPAFLTSASPTREITTPTLTLTLGGYVPRNRKLYCYPYNFLYVSNNCGEKAEYKWEYFNNGTQDKVFKLKGNYLTSPSVICYPENYRGISHDYEDGICYTNFPVCPIVSNAFETWWGDNKNSFVMGNISSAVSSVGQGFMTGMMTGVPEIGVASAAISLFSQTLNSVGKVEDIKAQAPQTKGQLQSDSLNAKLGRVGFTFYHMSVKGEVAKIIDDFFQRYGYAVKTNKVPNRHVRPYFTYTKTIGCTVSGSVPANDMNAICQIYDKGITFWDKNATVGEYDVNNAPQTE